MVRRKGRRRVVMRVVMRQSFSPPLLFPLPLRLPFRPLQFPFGMPLLSLLRPSLRLLFATDLFLGLFLVFLEALPPHEQEADLLALGGEFLFRDRRRRRCALVLGFEFGVLFGGFEILLGFFDLVACDEQVRVGEPVFEVRAG